MPKFTAEEDRRILACPAMDRSHRRTAQPSPLALLAEELGRTYDSVRQRRRRLQKPPRRLKREQAKVSDHWREKYRTDPAFRAADNARTREAQRRRRAKT